MGTLGTNRQGRFKLDTVSVSISVHGASQPACLPVNSARRIKKKKKKKTEDLAENSEPPTYPTRPLTVPP